VETSAELRVFKVDLHIHTVLSPCTEIAEMTPAAIVREASRKGLDVIAICDHNSARNAAATVRAGKKIGITVIPGMEITSAEEVHFVGLFPDSERAEAAQEEVYARLIGMNDENVFGVQAVVNEDDEVEDLDDRLLIGATTLQAERVVDLIHRFDGVAIASHVDRSGFGIFGQLGFIPETVKLDALEVSRRATYEAVREKYRQARSYRLVTSSDAHALKDIGSAVTLVRMAEPTFEELAKAVRGQDGRDIVDQPGP
jgi:3',5'-nucleoside bisphosphate phosphatase